MKKKIISFVLAAVLLSSVFVGVPFNASAGNWETENNDTYDTADYIAENGSITGELSNKNDVDYYRVIPDANGRLTITFKHKVVDSDCGWRIGIYGYLNGNYSLQSEKRIYLSDNESVSFPHIGVKKGVSYYIEVEKYDPYSYTSAEYTISTSFKATEYYEIENNDDYDSANKITIGKSYSGCLNNSSDVDYYKFVPSSNGELSFKFKHKYYSSDCGWRIDVYGYLNGNYSLQSSYYIDLSDNESFSFPHIGVKKGVSYYIKVEYKNCYRYTSAEYTISTSLNKTEYYEKEDNEDFYSANSIEIGKKYKGNLSLGNDVDNYKIKLSSNKKVTVKFTSPANSVYKVELFKYTKGEYKSINAVRTSNEPGKKTYNIAKVNSKGTYYLTVKRYDSYSALSTSPYTVQAYVAPTLKKVDGKYYYVKDGVVGYKATLIFKYSGKYYYIKDGVFTKTTGLVKCGSKWYHVVKGMYNPDESARLVGYKGKLYYCNGGVRKSTSNTLFKYKGKYYHVNKGICNPKEKVTFVKYKGKYYYCKNGVANLKYNGKVKYNGKKYTVKNGIRK